MPGEWDARATAGSTQPYSTPYLKNAGKGATYPRRLTAYELAGLAYGPVAYLRSRSRTRRASS